MDRLHRQQAEETFPRCATVDFQADRGEPDRNEIHRDGGGGDNVPRDSLSFLKSSCVLSAYEDDGVANVVTRVQFGRVPRPADGRVGE